MLVVCILWEDPNYRYKNRYSVKHVNTLFNMLSRHTEDFEFVCVTNCWRGLNRGINTLPFDDSLLHVGGTYPKLQLFSPQLRDQLKEFVFVDLDAIVVGDISFIGRAKGFSAIECLNPSTPFNTGLFKADAVELGYIWDEFKPPESLIEVATECKYISWDQAWMNLKVRGKINLLTSKDGVYDYRQLSGGVLPENARIVMFAGDNDPSKPSIQHRNPWVRENWR